MQRALEYIIFFVAVVLLQALLFDNLMFSGLVVPLYYVVFLLLLPVECGRVALLVLGTLLGVVMDVSMGTPGLNTMASAAVAYLRPMVMNLTMGKDVQHETVPYGGAIGEEAFLFYAGVLILCHEAIFFGFESLGSHFFFTILKIIVSSVVTLGTVWLTARLFRLWAR